VAGRAGRYQSDDPSFSVVRSNDTDEVLACTINLPIALGGYNVVARLYPDELIELRSASE
jgi:hypothetical protein